MATISQIKMPNNTTHDIVKNSFYGTCDTAAATAAKVVTLSSDSTGWSLKAGVIIGVKFTNTNSASSVTLNVNGSGAKSIWYNNAIYTGNNNNITGAASRTNYYMYDGTYWVFLHNGIIDSNTDTKVTQTADDSTASDFEVIFSATADNTTRTEAARKSSKLKFNPSTGNLQATQLNGVAIGSSPKFTDNDTKNTAGSTDSSSKLFLIGATSQAANPQTYSHDTAYVGTDGCLYSGGTKVLTAHQDISGKVNKSGDTMTGDLIFNKTGATDLTQVQMKCGSNDYGRIAAGATAGNAGYLEIATADDGTEPIYVRQYSGTFATKGNEATLLDGSGNTSFPKKLSAKIFQELITGSGTAAQDKGASVSPRYFPAKWTFNTGLTPANGDTITIKIPVAGHDYGVFLSINNGTNYYPVARNNTARLTTHYANGCIIQLVFESAGSVNDVFPLAGGDARTNVSGGRWTVTNFYDSGNTNNAVTQTASTGNADYEVLFSVTADNTTRTEGARKNSNLKFNPSTGNLQATQLNGVAIGSSPKFTDTTYSAGSNITLSGTEFSLTKANVTGALGYTPPTSDTNNAVTQTATSTSADYEVLFSATADNTTRTEGARKNSNLKFNPSTGNLQATQLNGVAIGSSPKFTDNDTKNTAGSTDTSSKIFLVGATSQAANPQTYSHDTAYVGTDGCLYSGGTKVLTGHQTIKQDGITGATVNRFGTCSTAAATAAKAVNITTGTFALEAGTTVAVKFTYTNTANSPTLNVNSKGAKNIFVNGVQITSGTDKSLLAGTVVFVYDGTQWNLIGNYYDTKYGAGTGISMSNLNISTSCLRVSASANNVPGQNLYCVKEYTAGSANLPDSSNFYFILNMQGGDSNYAAQLAIGMTTEKMYYRSYRGGTWYAWKQITLT